jgi:valyl-tRNA synthetase
MHHGLRDVLGLLAPFLPFVTEELYQRLFAAQEPHRCLATSPWPAPHDGIAAVPEMTAVLAVLRAVRAERSRAGVAQGTELAHLAIQVDDADLAARLHPLVATLRAATRVREVAFAPASTETHHTGVRITLHG